MSTQAQRWIGIPREKVLIITNLTVPFLINTAKHHFFFFKYTDFKKRFLKSLLKEFIQAIFGTEIFKLGNNRQSGEKNDKHSVLRHPWGCFSSHGHLGSLKDYLGNSDDTLIPIATIKICILVIVTSILFYSHARRGYFLCLYYLLPII